MKARDVSSGFSEKFPFINHSYICVVLSGFARLSEEKKRFFGRMVIGKWITILETSFNEKKSLESLVVLQILSTLGFGHAWVTRSKNIPKDIKILLQGGRPVFEIYRKFFNNWVFSSPQNGSIRKVNMLELRSENIMKIFPT